MKLLICALCGMGILAGCASSGESNADKTSTHVVEMSGRKLNAAEIRSCVKWTDSGDGAAAYALYSHYALGDYNDQLSRKYFKRALELEYPAALYMEAFMVWSRQESPDMDYVERLVRRAMELGYSDEKSVLGEVLAARESGVIPRKTKLRFFRDIPGKSETKSGS